MTQKRFSPVAVVSTLALALALSGCDTLATPGRAYQNCVNRTVLKLVGSKADRISTFSKDLNFRIAEQECRSAFEPCQDNETGRGCQKFLRKYSKAPKKVLNRS